MIEIVYKEEKQEARGNEAFFSLPKNIRQIGETRGARKIYLEDYVYTFLKKVCQENGRAGRTAILFGQYKWSEGQDYLFIQSAMELEMEISAEHISFTDQVWSEVHDTAQKYFEGQDILGWFLCLPQNEFEITELITKTHLNHFAGNDKVLFMMEPSEREEAFFSYEGGSLRRESGFYIYYEKNEPMQEYMIAHGKNSSIEESGEIGDRAVSDFRKAIGKGREEKKELEKSGGRGMVYTLAACVAVAVLAVGVSYARDAGIVGELLGKDDGRARQEQQARETAAGAQGERIGGYEEDADASGGADGQSGDEKIEKEDPEETGQVESAQTGAQSGETPQNTKEQGTDGQASAGNDGTEAEAGKKTQDGTGTENKKTESGADKEGETEPARGEKTDEDGKTESKSPETVRKDGKDTEAGTQDSKSTQGQASAAAGGSAVQNTAPAREYTVQKGDTLSKICMAVYGDLSRVDEICELNHLNDAGLIFEGQKLVLPQ